MESCFWRHVEANDSRASTVVCGVCHRWLTQEEVDVSRKKRLMEALTTTDVNIIIRYVLAEKLMADQLVEDRADYGLRYWKAQLDEFLTESGVDLQSMRDD